MDNNIHILRHPFTLWFPSKLLRMLSASNYSFFNHRRNIKDRTNLVWLINFGYRYKTCLVLLPLFCSYTVLCPSCVSTITDSKMYNICRSPFMAYLLISILLYPFSGLCSLYSGILEIGRSLRFAISKYLNLWRWRFRPDAKCHFCENPWSTVQHILNG